MTSVIEDHPEESTKLKHQQFSDHWEENVIEVQFLTLH